MRKPISHSTLFLALLLFYGNPAFGQLLGDTFESAKKSKSAKFYYVYDEVYGLTNTDEQGIVSGVLVDMMSEFESFVKNREGIEVSVEYVFEQDFDSFLKNVNTGIGGVFGLSNISISDERKKQYSFSPPYLENVSMLLTNSKVPALTSMTDISTSFQGMTAYTLSQSTYHDRLLKIKKQYFPEMEIVEHKAIPPIMEQLRTNSKSFAVLDLNVYIEVLQKKWPVRRHPVGDLKGDQFGVIMPKGSDWEPLIKDFLVEFYGSSDYAKIISENLGGSALRLIDSINN